MHKFGTVIGGGIAFLEQNILHRPLPITFHDTMPDYAALKPGFRMQQDRVPETG